MHGGGPRPMTSSPPLIATQPTRQQQASNKKAEVGTETRIGLEKSTPRPENPTAPVGPDGRPSLARSIRQARQLALATTLLNFVLASGRGYYLDAHERSKPDVANNIMHVTDIHPLSIAAADAARCSQCRVCRELPTDGTTTAKSGFVGQLIH